MDESESQISMLCLNYRSVSIQVSQTVAAWQGFSTDYLFDLSCRCLRTLSRLTFSINVDILSAKRYQVISRHGQTLSNSELVEY
jgi:hypothetical protein